MSGPNVMGDIGPTQGGGFLTGGYAFAAASNICEWTVRPESFFCCPSLCKLRLTLEHGHVMKCHGQEC